MKLALSRHGHMAAIVSIAIGVALIDILTGSELRVSPFYFLPIVLASRWFDRRVAYSMAGICTAFWLVSNIEAGMAYSSNWVWIWNTVVEAAAFIIVASIVAQLNDSLQREREAAQMDRLTGLLNSRAFRERAPIL